MKTRAPKVTAAPPPTFEIGERVTYYPACKKGEDNTHFAAEVIGVSPKGRLRICFFVHLTGKLLRTVSPRALARQNELPI